MARTPGRPAARTVRLTARDLKLLGDLMLLRAATLDQLARNHFASRKTALNRLRLLVRGGYLSREAVPLLDQPQPTSVYTLTTQGDDALRRLSLLSERILDA